MKNITPVKVSIALVFLPNNYDSVFKNNGCTCICQNMQLYIETEIFQGLILGRISAPSQLENEQNILKIVYIIPKFFVLHFSENFMKIRTIIPKLQIMKICIKR